jgi:hypothetical protein
MLNIPNFSLTSESDSNFVFVNQIIYNYEKSTFRYGIDDVGSDCQRTGYQNNRHQCKVYQNHSKGG